MKFCEKCGAFVDEKKRINGYLYCTNNHQIEDEYTNVIREREKRLSEEIEQKRIKEKEAIEEKRLLEYKTESNKIEQLLTIKIERYNILRLMNPYEGQDKLYWDSNKDYNKSRKDSAPFYDKLMPSLEKDLDPKDFIYLRGERKGGLNSAAIVLVTDEFKDFVINKITSFPIPDGTNINHYWLEPFIPPTNSYIDLKIKKEVAKRLERLQKAYMEEREDIKENNL